MPSLHELPCRICRNPAAPVGSKRGQWRSQEYLLYRCSHCDFAFVGNPSTDYDQLYALKYYEGQGADPKMDAMTELHHPRKTVRQYEWRGIAALVSDLQPLTLETRWLDFGCGSGDLVRWVMARRGCDIVGFETGAIAEIARSRDIPILTAEQLAAQANCYDVITAIDVLEHVEDPIAVLQQIFGLLKEGGVFFYTTQNAGRYRDRLPQWSHIIPETRISFYEPSTLKYALTTVGFDVRPMGYQAGFNDIIRCRVLKNLGIKRTQFWEQLLPWGLLSSWVDRQWGMSSFPIGRKGDPR